MRTAACLLLLLLAKSAYAQTARLYREPWRPQFHFTPATHWMNDPNGLVFYDGEYHLFYQFNPFGDTWGHMSWGHAVSKDLVRWMHLPVALYEENDIMIFSGSAVVDWKNTSGFGQRGKPPLVAIYTGHYTKKPLQNQHIAYSNDRGRTWTKYSGNPVLDIGEREFRDPKVFWHEPTRRWVMVAAWPTHRKVRFYASPNLKDWTHLSDFGPAGSTTGIWECPDLFPIAVETGREIVNHKSKIINQRWGLIVNVGSGAPAGGSGCQYFVGDFDGRRFTLDASFPKPEPEFVPDGKLLADFEGSDYAGWQANGDAFGAGPARGKIGGQQPVDGFRGGGLVNTFRDGDKAQGTLTSPEFEITHDYLSFLIGGGNHAGKTCMNLLTDGRVARTATGDNAERLTWKSWTVRELRGRRATLEIVDRETAGWGHINLDHVLLADEPARPATVPALWADFGPDFYAAVSWSDIPKRDGRRLWIGWMSNWQYAGAVPTSPWRSAMSLPRELALRRTPAGLRLVQQPVRELRNIRGQRFRLGQAAFSEANDWLRRHQVAGDQWEIEVEFDVSGNAADFGLRFLPASNQETVIRCDPSRQVLALDRTRAGRADFHAKFAGAYEAPLRLRDGRVRLHLFIDRSSVEIFGNDGDSTLTALVLPGPSSAPMELWPAGSAVTVQQMRVWRLKPAHLAF
jgi:sucrose-6-phosphate hydrolase SacC (GH32 family)